ncbi:MAG: helix-turn-helix domain-containing protein, partial [Candidatus Heimdallarchaeota archaeon]|nr:helix-turn-helix domain-containing protein [Candidatus Heimdallarchaeota archaeon]
MLNPEEHEKFFHKVTTIFQQSNYNLSTPLLGEGGCFDLVARKKQVLLLVKLLENIDSLREEYAFELRKLALMLTGFPLIIGQRIRSDSDIEDGVVYSRYEIPVISLETLRALLLQHLPPLVYASRGGLKVKFDGERLRQKRLERNLSLKDFAKKVGVSKRAIYEYERGTIDVSLETALKIEEFLDTPLTMAINLFEEINKIGSLNH